MEFYNVVKGTSGSYSRSIMRLKHHLMEDDAVIIGAGKGFVEAAGIGTGDATDCNWDSFRSKFFDFTVQYGIQNIKMGMLYPFLKPEERWAWLSRVIWWKKYETAESKVYQKLKEILQDKEYFIITSEPDNLFVENGFPPERIFETEGSYSKFQCDGKCDSNTFLNREQVEEMMKSQGFAIGPVGNMYIPDGVVAKTSISSNLIPTCPICGGHISPNISIDNELVHDDDYYIMNSLYDNFLKKYDGKKILFLELGVEREYVEDIRIPFWNMAGNNLKATYASINLDGTYYPTNMKERSILIEGDIRVVIKNLTQNIERAVEPTS